MCAGGKTSTANGKVEAECIHEQRKYTPSSKNNPFRTDPMPFRHSPIAPPAYFPSSLCLIAIYGIVTMLVRGFS